jgi:hypothetical protein
MGMIIIPSFTGLFSLIRRFDAEAAAEWMIMNIENPNVDDPLNPNQLRRLMQAFNQEGNSRIFFFSLTSVETEEQNSIEAQMKEAVANNKCTYTVTKKQYAAQKWYAGEGFLLGLGLDLGLDLDLVLVLVLELVLGFVFCWVLIWIWIWIWFWFWFWFWN